MNSENLSEFAKHYAKAWSSDNPERVAAFFAENGSLKVNDVPAGGRTSSDRGSCPRIHAQFPDMILTFDKLESHANRLVVHWTLTGTNTGPGELQTRIRR